MTEAGGGECTPVVHATAGGKESQGLLIGYLKTWDLVAFSGVVTFVTTLAYEYGRAKYWRVSTDLIRFTPEHAVVVFAYIVVGGLPLLQGVSELIKFGDKALAIVMASMIVLAAGVEAFRMCGGDGVAVLVGAILYVAAAYFICTGTLELGPVGRRVVGALGKPALALSAILVSMALFGVGAGYEVANQKTEFLVTSSVPQRLILMTYGSVAICSTFIERDGVYELSPLVQVIDLTNPELAPLETKSAKSIVVKK